MSQQHDRMTRVVEHATWVTATLENLAFVSLEERPAVVHIWQVVSALAGGLEDVVSRQLKVDEPTAAVYRYLSALRELASEVRDYLRDGDEQADFERRRREFA